MKRIGYFQSEFFYTVDYHELPDINLEMHKSVINGHLYPMKLEFFDTTIYEAIAQSVWPLDYLRPPFRSKKNDITHLEKMAELPMMIEVNRYQESRDKKHGLVRKTIRYKDSSKEIGSHQFNVQIAAETTNGNVYHKILWKTPVIEILEERVDDALEKTKKPTSYGGNSRFVSAGSLHDGQMIATRTLDTPLELIFVITQLGLEWTIGLRVGKNDIRFFLKKFYDANEQASNRGVGLINYRCDKHIEYPYFTKDVEKQKEIKAWNTQNFYWHFTMSKSEYAELPWGVKVAMLEYFSIFPQDVLGKEADDALGHASETAIDLRYSSDPKMFSLIVKDVADMGYMKILEVNTYTDEEYYRQNNHRQTMIPLTAATSARQGHEDYEYMLKHCFDPASLLGAPERLPLQPRKLSACERKFPVPLRPDSW
jgi:hypothetical protein